jgi:hypothetical protein
MQRRSFFKSLVAGAASLVCLGSARAKTLKEMEIKCIRILVHNRANKLVDIARWNPATGWQMVYCQDVKAGDSIIFGRVEDGLIIRGTLIVVKDHYYENGKHVGIVVERELGHGAFAPISKYSE